MSENKQPTEQAQGQALSTYQTGSTTPPKSRVGFLTVLLSLIIVICGISTILSLMRINVMNMLLHQTETQKCSMAFTEPEAAPAKLEQSCLRFHGEPLDEFWQNYRQLPQGIYVTDPGDSQPLEAGDVLVSVGGTQVTDWDTVNTVVCQYEPGQKIPVSIYRNGVYAFVYLTIYE